MGLGWGLSYCVVCSLIVGQQRSSLGVQSNSPGPEARERLFIWLMLLCSIFTGHLLLSFVRGIFIAYSFTYFKY